MVSKTRKIFGTIWKEEEKNSKEPSMHRLLTGIKNKQEDLKSGIKDNNGIMNRWYRYFMNLLVADTGIEREDAHAFNLDAIMKYTWNQDRA